MSLVLTGKSYDFKFCCGLYSPNDKLKLLKSNPREMIFKPRHIKIVGDTSFITISVHKQYFNPQFLQVKLQHSLDSIKIIKPEITFNANQLK